MDGKTVLQAALMHQNAGKVPVDFGATPVTGIHVDCVDKLRRYYGLPKRLVKVCEPYQMLGLIEDDLADAMGVTVTGVTQRTAMFGFENSGWKEYRLDSGLQVLVPEGFNTTKGADGSTYMYPQGDITAPPCARMPKGGLFFDAITRQQPFDEDAPCVEDNLEEFTPASPQDLAYLKSAVQNAAAARRGVVAGAAGAALGDIALVPAVGLKHPKGIRDVEEWYVTIASRQAFVHELFEKQTDIALENLRLYYDAMGNALDVIYICGTDFGTQTSTFCSADTFRDLYMPYYKKINNWVHTHTPWKTFKHSCGAIADMIPLFIESGFDILNPVQCSCPGMAPEQLKQTFGTDIVFWGGGVDTQQTLPFGTPGEVKEQVLRRLEIFSKGGGYVFNAIHNIQGDTPIENIVAMLNAVAEFNG